MTAPLKLAVLDCDGTMVDSQTAIVRSVIAAFERVEVPSPEPDAIIRIVGLHLPDAMSVLTGGERPEMIAPLVEAYKNVAAQHRDDGEWENPLYPHAKEVIRSLDADGWLLGVATGKSKRGLDMVFEAHGIGHHFVTAQTSDFGPGKPAPDMLHRAMSEAGIEAQYTVMIGDTTYDMEMAVNAGTKAIGVSWGYHADGELLSAGADVIIHGYWDLPSALEDLVDG